MRRKEQKKSRKEQDRAEMSRKGKEVKEIGGMR